MTDILIRNLDEDDVSRLDKRASRLGLSRNEFIRRTLSREAHIGEQTITKEDWERFADLASDMLSEDFERRAWS